MTEKGFQGDVNLYLRSDKNVIISRNTFLLQQFITKTIWLKIRLFFELKYASQKKKQKAYVTLNFCVELHLQGLP